MPRKPKSQLDYALSLLDTNPDLAVPHFRQILAQRPPREEQRVALIGLGAALRAARNPKPAIRNLQKARKLFRDDIASRLFLALAHYDAGQHALAIRQLSHTLLVKSPPRLISPFRSALTRQYHACR